MLHTRFTTPYTSSITLQRTLTRTRGQGGVGEGVTFVGVIDAVLTCLVTLLQIQDTPVQPREACRTLCESGHLTPHTCARPIHRQSRPTPCRRSRPRSPCPAIPSNRRVQAKTKTPCNLIIFPLACINLL